MKEQTFCFLIFKVYVCLQVHLWSICKKPKREDNWVLLLMFCWMLMDMCLPKFDAYQGAIARSCFKSHTNFWFPYFFQKKVCLKSSLKFTLFDVTSVLPDNLSGIKKNYFQTCAEINTLSFNSPKQMLCKLFFLQLGKATIGTGL